MCKLVGLASRLKHLTRELVKFLIVSAGSGNNCRDRLTVNVSGESLVVVYMPGKNQVRDPVRFFW
jgi:hypothetical protein